MTWRGSDDAIRNLIAREIWRYQECRGDFDAPDSMMGDLQRKLCIDQAECIQKVVFASPVVKACVAHNSGEPLTKQEVLDAHAQFGRLDKAKVKAGMGVNWPEDWDDIAPGEGIFQ